MFEDYRLDNGLYYKKDDNSGPYSIDSAGVATLMGKVGTADGTPLDVNIASASGSVTINVDEADLAALGAKADAAASSDTGTFSVIAFMKRGLQNWTTFLSRFPSSLGVKTSANSLSVTVASDQIVQVGAIANVFNSFAVPNSAATYSVGDLIANSATPGSVTPLSFANVARVAAGACSIVKMRMYKTGTGITGAAFKLHLFSALPAVTNGDDGVFLPNQAASYLGAFEFGLSNMLVHSDGVSCNGTTQTGYPITVDLSSGTTIYGLLEARGAYVRTAAETFGFTAEIEQE